MLNISYPGEYLYPFAVCYMHGNDLPLVAGTAHLQDFNAALFES